MESTDFVILGEGFGGNMAPRVQSPETSRGKANPVSRDKGTCAQLPSADMDNDGRY